MNYKDWRSTRLAPAWMQKKWGLAWNQTLGNVGDLQVNAGQQAAAIAYIDSCPADALNALGASRNIDRYPADTDESYRARIKDVWNVWPFAGTYQGVLGQLEAFGFTNVAIYDVHSTPVGLGTWPPQPMGPEPSWWTSVFPAVTWPPTAGANSAKWWSRFWVVISEPFPAVLGWQLRTWGNTYTWNQNGPDGSAYTWGSTATINQVNSIRSLIEKWKPVDALCAGIWINYTTEGVILKWPGRADGIGS